MEVRGWREERGWRGGEERGEEGGGRREGGGSIVGYCIKKKIVKNKT